MLVRARRRALACARQAASEEQPARALLFIYGYYYSAASAPALAHKHMTTTRRLERKERARKKFVAACARLARSAQLARRFVCYRFHLRRPPTCNSMRPRASGNCAPRANSATSGASDSRAGPKWRRMLTQARAGGEQRRRRRRLQRRQQSDPLR